MTAGAHSSLASRSCSHHPPRSAALAEEHGARLGDALRRRVAQRERQLSEDARVVRLGRRHRQQLAQRLPGHDGVGQAGGHAHLVLEHEEAARRGPRTTSSPATDIQRLTGAPRIDGSKCGELSTTALGTTPASTIRASPYTSRRNSSRAPSRCSIPRRSPDHSSASSRRGTGSRAKMPSGAASNVTPAAAQAPPSCARRARRDRRAARAARRTAAWAPRARRRPRRRARRSSRPAGRPPGGAAPRSAASSLAVVSRAKCLLAYSSKSNSIRTPPSGAAPTSPRGSRTCSGTARASRAAGRWPARRSTRRAGRPPRSAPSSLFTAKFPRSK